MATTGDDPKTIRAPDGELVLAPWDVVWRGDVIPCTGDHEHTEMCQIFGDAPAYIPTGDGHG